MSVYIDTEAVLIDVKVPKEARRAIRGSEWVWGAGLQGLITEIRCWNINLNPTILKENWKGPCEFVHEQLAKFRVKGLASQKSKGLAKPKGLAGPPKKRGGFAPPPKARAGLAPPPARAKPKQEEEKQ